VIDVDYLRHQPSTGLPLYLREVDGLHRLRLYLFSKVIQICSRGQMSRHRTEDVSTVEAVGDRLYVIALVRKVYRSPDATKGFGRGEEETVVRAYEVSPALHLGGKRSPLGFIPRIYHGQVHSVLRHIPRGVLEQLRSPDHVEGGDSVCYVDYGSLGCDARHHAFARAHQLVGEAIV
jgi:hypothetical protein